MPYRTPLTVRFADVDPAAMVYYPRLVHYFHLAMEDYFRDVVGMEYARFLSDHGLGFPTVRLEVDFREPLRYGDELEVEVEVERLGSTSVEWRYQVFKSEAAEAAATARIVTVNIDLETLEKKPLPEWLRRGLRPSG